MSLCPVLRLDMMHVSGGTSDAYQSSNVRTWSDWFNTDNPQHDGVEDERADTIRMVSILVLTLVLFVYTEHIYKQIICKISEHWKTSYKTYMNSVPASSITKYMYSWSILCNDIAIYC